MVPDVCEMNECVRWGWLRETIPNRANTTLFTVFDAVVDAEEIGESKSFAVKTINEY